MADISKKKITFTEYYKRDVSAAVASILPNVKVHICLYEKIVSKVIKKCFVIFEFFVFRRSVSL